MRLSEKVQCTRWYNTEITTCCERVLKSVVQSTWCSTCIHSVKSSAEFTAVVRMVSLQWIIAAQHSVYHEVPHTCTEICCVHHVHSVVPTGVHCEVPTAVCCVHTPFVLWGGPHSSYHVHCTPCVLWSPPQQLPCTPCALWSPHSRGEFFGWGSEACWLRLNHCSAIDTLCNLSNLLSSSKSAGWILNVDQGWDLTTAALLTPLCLASLLLQSVQLAFIV